MFLKLRFMVMSSVIKKNIFSTEMYGRFLLLTVSMETVNTKTGKKLL